MIRFAPWQNARVTVSIASAALERRMARAVTRAIRDAYVGPRRDVRIVEVPSREELDGAIVLVPVTARGARRLPELVASIRERAPLGVQLVWDGKNPPRAAVERYVFAALEEARSDRKGPPVVLAESREPAAALRFIIERNA